MTNQTKRYRLKKDLPGVKAGTVFDLVAPDPNSMTTFAPHYITEDGLGKLPAEGVENNPDWFEEVVETPYPWKPKRGERYWYFDGSFASTFLWDNYPTDRDLLAANNVFRTKEDVEEAAAKIVKLALKAVQEKLNRKGWKPKEGEMVWCMALIEGSFVPFPTKHTDAPFPTEESCQAACDVINALLR